MMGEIAVPDTAQMPLLVVDSGIAGSWAIFLFAQALSIGAATVSWR